MYKRQRYGIRPYAVAGRDYQFVNGDSYDYRYANILVINRFHGVLRHIVKGITKYRTMIHINGNYLVGTYSSEEKAAVAYNKAVDLAKAAGIKKDFPENYVDTLPPCLLYTSRTLPTSFVRDIIMKAPSKDMMNTLARSVLTLYSYDDLADDISLPNVLRQCLQLISLFPLLSVYGYQAYKHYHDGASLFIHPPKAEYSTAENILHILRPDSQFTPLEAKLLDTALILHMEHGLSLIHIFL